MFVGSCTPEQYKTEADNEVYRIIDGKWQTSHGRRVNYAIVDANRAPDAITLDPNEPVMGRLSLAQALAIATSNNRRYQSQKEQLYRTALDLTLERHNFANQWFGTIDSEYLHAPGDESLGMETSTGFDRLLAGGARVSVGLAADWLRFLTGDPRTTLGSVLTATIRQPLMQDAGREVVQENLTQAERNVLYEIRRFNRYRKTFVVDMVRDYYNVLQALDRVKNDKNNYDNLLANEKRVSMMADTGRVPRFQQDEVRQSTLKAQDSYIRSMEAYKGALDRFKITLALPVDVEIQLDPNELDALETIGIAEPNLNVQDAVAAAVGMRLDLANARDNVDDAERKIVVAADRLEGGLDIIAGLGLPSAENHNAGRYMYDNGTYRLGVSADLPLDKKAQRNEYRRALINLDETRRNWRESLDEVKFDVRQAYRDLEKAYTSYKIQLLSLELAEKRVDMQMILLQEGRATTRNYLDAQDDLLLAQNAKTQALIDFTLARLRFYRDVGLLQVRPDGLWEEPDRQISNNIEREDEKSES